MTNPIPIQFSISLSTDKKIYSTSTKLCGVFNFKIQQNWKHQREGKTY